MGKFLKGLKGVKFDRDVWSKVPIIGRMVESNEEIAAKKQMQDMLNQVKDQYSVLTWEAPKERMRAGQAAAHSYDNSSNFLNTMSGGKYNPDFDKMFTRPNVGRLRGGK